MSIIIIYLIKKLKLFLKIMNFIHFQVLSIIFL